MPDLIQRALNAKRESKYIEFKEDFNPASSQEWCEIIKDIIAIANSGGGVILVGVNNKGKAVGCDIQSLLNIDPADFVNKIYKYTGTHFSGIGISEHTRSRKKICSMLISGVDYPFVFIRPGTYPIDQKRQKTAFSIGTVYFRHGAKSEPGNSNDIRKVIEKQLSNIRKTWLSGVRKVVRAPIGAKTITYVPTTYRKDKSLLSTVRVVNDPDAIPVRLTSRTTNANAVLIHQELSDMIFDEINNVVNVNTVLSKNNGQFLLGESIYYRIYAERECVRSDQSEIETLSFAALNNFYAPLLYWLSILPDKSIANLLFKLSESPKSPHVHFLIKFVSVLGAEFLELLHKKWKTTWGGISQPPSYYLKLKELYNTRKQKKTLAQILNLSNETKININHKSSTVSFGDMIGSSQRASEYLTESCMMVFNGHKEYRDISRKIDFLAYAPVLTKRAQKLLNAFKNLT